MYLQKSELKKASDSTHMDSHEQPGTYANYDDEQLKSLPEVERITRLFNLLSHDNIYISE